MNEQAQTAYIATQLFLSEFELAQRWKLSARGLQSKRLSNPASVPAFLKLSKAGIRYPLESVIQFENELLEKSRA